MPSRARSWPAAAQPDSRSGAASSLWDARRAEIGLRRALGATRGPIRIQFLAEALLLSTLGGGAAVLFGSAVTAGYASLQGWPTVVPAWVMGGAVAAALLIGALAGLYPAVRAARLAPTEALATT